MKITKELAIQCLPELIKLWKTLNLDDQMDCLYEPAAEALNALNVKAGLKTADLVEPNMDIAYMFAAAGRFHLVVAGIVVATQGQRCTDSSLFDLCERRPRVNGDMVWTVDAMSTALKQINEKHAANQ